MEKSRNKPPSRIQIAISRTNSQDVDKYKISLECNSGNRKKATARDSGIVNSLINLKLLGLSFKRQNFRNRIRLFC